MNKPKKKNLNSNYKTMPIIKKHFSLSPTNDNPVVLSVSGADDMTLSGGFSHKQGFPTIKFSIPPQPSMLEMSSLKLTGQILVKQADNTVLVAKNNGALYSNGRIDGTANGRTGQIEDDTDTGMLKQTAINLPNWGGVQNVLDKVVIQSKKSLIELTSVHNYGQYSGITECYNNNDDDYLISPLTKSLSGGAHATHINRRLLTCSNASAPAVPMVAGTGSGPRSLSGGSNDRMIGQFFSIPIKVDLLGGQSLFLDDDYLGGLLITLHLAPDSSVFANRWNDAAGNTVAPNDASALNYVLKNVKLEGRYLVPDEKDMAMIPPVLSMDSRLNLINDVHSSVNANAYTPQLQSVKSLVNVFLDNDQTNTFTKNQNNFRRMPGEKANQQARNGLRFPYNYETQLKPNFESVTETGGGVHSIATLQFPSLVMGDGEVRKQFEAALLNGGKPYHSSATLKVSDDRMKEDASAAAANNEGRNDNTVADCVGIGADYTLGIGMTQNFVNQDYNLTTKSGVNTANALLNARRNGAGTANPLLEQSFVRYNSQFDTQSLIKTI